MGIKDYVYLGVIALLVTFAGTQTFRLTITTSEAETAKANYAQLEKSVAEERLAAEQAARSYEATLAAKESQHAKEQQNSLSEFNATIARVTSERDAALSERKRMRNSYEALQSRFGSADFADAATCRGIADQAGRLAGMAEESGRLLVEGKELLAKRDAQVTLLLGIVLNDREAAHVE